MVHFIFFHEIHQFFFEASHGVLYVSLNILLPNEIQECHIYIYQTMSCFQPG